MNFKLFSLCVALALLAACASKSDAWRDAARSPIDTGSAVWWEQTKRGF